ncbi:MAG: hypothetical protein GWP70_00650 [Proteobacteria bacterium]|nr:hypothetical protein [Pseudomonadota bacterium]
MLQHLQTWLPRLLTFIQWLGALAVAFVIANTVLVVMGDTKDSSPTAPSAPSASVNKRPPAPALQALLDQDLFGRSSASANTPSATPATPTRLPLTLEAVFVSSDPEQSTAIISERGKPGKLYGAGDSVPGNARLSKVEAERVILTRAGVREALAFKYDFRVKQNTRTATTAPQAVPPANTANLNADASVLESLNTQLAQNPDAALDKIGVSRSAEGGYRIGSSVNHPYLVQSGLQPGDVVLAINGRPLGDVNVDRLALSNLASAGSVTVELLRNGQNLTITTRIPANLRQ